jgi:hypothetical protein
MDKLIAKTKKHINKNSILPLSVPFFFILSLFYCLFLHYKETKNYKEIQNSMIKVPVVYPNEKPIHPTKDIDLAMALFSIDIPENAIYPIYSLNLPYRGLTTGDAFLSAKQVIIGDMAFTSWGILGSTLAHEIEVHCNQSFLKIEFLNFLDLVIKYPEEFILKIYASINTPPYGNIGFGAYLAEKEAYTYEINSKERFNLSPEEVIAIRNTLDNELI